MGVIGKAVDQVHPECARSSSSPRQAWPSRPGRRRGTATRSDAADAGNAQMASDTSESRHFHLPAKGVPDAVDE